MYVFSLPPLGPALQLGLMVPAANALVPFPPFFCFAKRWCLLAFLVLGEKSVTPPLESTVVLLSSLTDFRRSSYD